jgi:hypothetical protein
MWLDVVRCGLTGVLTNCVKTFGSWTRLLVDTFAVALRPDMPLGLLGSRQQRAAALMRLWPSLHHMFNLSAVYHLDGPQRGAGA